MRSRQTILPTLLVALALFGVTFEFLVMQLESGRDPALGPASVASTPAKARPRKKLIITKVIPAGGGPAGQTTASYAGSVAGSPPPVTSSAS